MGIVKVGFDPNAETSVKPFDLGVYDFKINESKVKPANGPGKHPQLELLLECVGSESGAGIGKKTRFWASFSPNSVPYFLKPLIEVCGIFFENDEVPGADGTPIPALSFDPDHLLGKAFQMKCTSHEARQEGQGLREKWGFFAVSEYNVPDEAPPEEEQQQQQQQQQAAPASAPRGAAAPGPRAGGAVPPRGTVPGAARR